MRFFTTFWGHKLFASSRFEDGSTHLDDVGHTAGGHGEDFIFNQPLVSPVNTKDFQIVVGTGTYDGTNASIHAWGVATRC